MFRSISFTETGRANFHSFLVDNAKGFDLAFEQIKHGYELEALEVFEGRGEDETLSYELRQHETISGLPETFYPDDADLEITFEEVE